MSNSPAHSTLQHPESLQLGHYKIETRDAGAVMREATGNSTRDGKSGLCGARAINFQSRGGR